MYFRSKVIDLVTDTNAYADNDVLFTMVEIEDFFPRNRPVKLQSLALIDKADQAQDIDIYFFSATGAVGTINTTYTLADPVAATFLCAVKVLIADYEDFVNGQAAYKGGLERIIAGTSTSLFVSGALRSGTPTYAADSLRLILGYEIGDR